MARHDENYDPTFSDEDEDREPSFSLWEFKKWLSEQCEDEQDNPEEEVKTRKRPKKS